MPIGQSGIFQHAMQPALSVKGCQECPEIYLKTIVTTLVHSSKVHGSRVNGLDVLPYADESVITGRL